MLCTRYMFCVLIGIVDYGDTAATESRLTACHICKPVSLHGRTSCRSKIVIHGCRKLYLTKNLAPLTFTLSKVPHKAYGYHRVRHFFTRALELCNVFMFSRWPALIWKYFEVEPSILLLLLLLRGRLRWSAPWSIVVQRLSCGSSPHELRTRYTVKWRN